ncbi:GNAT family N-acetyltransferase [Phytohabitans sp. ZYX-F-186]|uniref:GNAT family N-acetyltransferase n=1 Tax=Phytohabitans maris TaxID=3071409 RepID=A0ABU0ZPC3_9ACTN|nr:GNAT family N-acetyltransferase [Phytohabitans sp. ZYX-F-186]MDQ7907777.1 GNAT family N-acetyltransferase [Phytohabitans sp. ZYX-F-186]
MGAQANSQPEINDQGLVLRPWRAADAEAVHRACQDPAIQRWTRVPSPYRPEHARDFVTGHSAAAWREGTGAPFAVVDPDTGDLLASCGLVTIDRVLSTAEVGYWTAPWARGQGVATRATRAVSRWAFESLRLRRMVWQAEIGNHASRLVALRAGFRVEGYLRLADDGSEGWAGTLLPGDPMDPVLDATVVRRARVFTHPQPVLAAKGGLRLRPPEVRDFDAMTEACRDPESVRWTTVPDPYERAHAEDFALRITPTKWARGDGVVYAIAGPDGAWAGSIDLTISADDPFVGEVGFLAAPWVRGRGYTTAALTALCDWGFRSLGLARIVWRAHVGNVASRRVAEKAGFAVEGTQRGALAHRGQRKDAWVGGLVP